MSGVRGMAANAAGDQLWVVSDNILYFIAANGDRTSRGTLLTHRGHVGMQVGLTQLVIVDGANGYVLDLTTNAFNRITAAGWLGSNTVGYLDGYFIFVDPDSQTFYISAIDNANSLDALQFASATGSPDDLVAVIVDHREAWFFGASSVEVWQDSGGTFPLARNEGAFIQTGCMAAFTAARLDNSIFWLGQNEQGAGQVFRAQGFQGMRVSTMAVEQAIQGAIAAGADITQACAYAYQHNGHAFYCLQVPGLDTTWCYDVASGQWHERAELVAGDYDQHRGDYHAYAYGKHIIGGQDAEILYAYDVDANTNAGDVLVRDRVSPHFASPQLNRISFGAFELDCTVGKGIAGQAQATVMLRYSNDGGVSWGSWRYATLGAVGETLARARFLRCGSARDRVWQVRCTDDTPFAIIAAAIEPVL